MRWKCLAAISRSWASLGALAGATDLAVMGWSPGAELHRHSATRITLSGSAINRITSNIIILSWENRTLAGMSACSHCADPRRTHCPASPSGRPTVIFAEATKACRPRTIYGSGSSKAPIAATGSVVEVDVVDQTTDGIETFQTADFSNLNILAEKPLATAILVTIRNRRALDLRYRPLHYKRNDV